MFIVPILIALQHQVDFFLHDPKFLDHSSGVHSPILSAVADLGLVYWIGRYESRKHK